MNVKDFITIRRLGTEKNFEMLEKGYGYFLKKDNTLTVLYHNGEPMNFLAYIEFAPKKEKGNHYHNKKVENMCVISGSIKARYFLFNNQKDIYEVDLNQGDIVTVMPGCVHTYISDNGAVAVEFSPNLFEVDDTIDLY